MPASQTTAVFIKPLDVLVLRGNKLFADAGSHGVALMPPWPSVAAGALRSRMLADAGVAPADFLSGSAALPGDVRNCLGTVADPGSFRISHFGLARQTDDGVEALLPLPADLVVTSDADAAHRVQPHVLNPALSSSYPLPVAPTFVQPKPAKAHSGLWLNAAGIRAWRDGQAITSLHRVRSSELWLVDSRLGIALKPGLNTAQDGQLYTSEAVQLLDNTKSKVGFIAEVTGAGNRLPTTGLLRFGGDGHAASLTVCGAAFPRPDFEALARNGRFRLMLTSPGLFPDGWRLTDTAIDGRWNFFGASARLACAAVPRLETVSGWDVARNRPKAALRAVPAGSVYWLDDFRGDATALEKIYQQGLALADATRRAEGFNSCLLAEWR